MPKPSCVTQAQQLTILENTRLAESGRFILVIFGSRGNNIATKHLLTVLDMAFPCLPTRKERMIINHKQLKYP